MFSEWNSDPFDPSAIENTVRYLLQNPEKAKEMRAGGPGICGS